MGKCLGVDVMNMLVVLFLVKKGEMLIDIVLMLNVMYFDLLVVCYL